MEMVNRRKTSKLPISVQLLIAKDIFKNPFYINLCYLFMLPQFLRLSEKEGVSIAATTSLVDGLVAISTPMW